MNPELAKKISAIPEIKEFIAFIGGEILKLDQLADIKLTNADEIALEVKARQRAVDKLKEILFPLVNVDNRTLGGSNADYVV
mgnify:CR=1 FL=1